MIDTATSTTNDGLETRPERSADDRLPEQQRATDRSNERVTDE
jgi:hypothetical protein